MSDLETQNVYEYFNRLAKSFGKVWNKFDKVILLPLGITFNSVTKVWTPQGTHKGGQSSTAKTEDAIEFLESMVEPRCLDKYPDCEHNGHCWHVPLIWGTEKEFTENKNLKFGILDARRLDDGGGNPNTVCLLVDGEMKSLNQVGQPYTPSTHRAPTDIFKVGVLECGVPKYLKILTMIQDGRFRSFSDKDWTIHYPPKAKTSREKKSGEGKIRSKKRSANEDSQQIVKDEPRSPKRRKVDETDPKVDEVGPQINEIDPKALTSPRGYFTEDGAFQADDLQVGEIGKISRYFSEYGSFQAHDLVEKVVEFQFPLDDEDQGFIDDLKCQECAIKFERSYDLLAHQEGMHSQIGDYECRICDIKFTQIFVLTEHIKNSHQIPKVDDKDPNLLIKTEIIEEEVDNNSETS